MTTSMIPSSLDSVVTNLNTAFAQLRQLAAAPTGEPGSTEPPTAQQTQATQPMLTADDLLQLTVLAEEVDDIVRRVAALKIRLERP